MKFTKMHGIGNDYVYVNAFVEPVNNPADVARRVSDRHFGIGSDGLILILPSDKAHVRMRMFNGDGSESEMCGNGIRCVAKYSYDHGLARVSPMRIETGRGILELDLTVEGGKAQAVTVNMGEPILESAKIPTTLPGPRVIDVPLPGYDATLPGAAYAWAESAGLDPRITCVSMGNPHVVIYVNDVAKVPLEQFGAMLERADYFPKRINVHIVQIHDHGTVTMRTWERGSGITLACGTGACAVAVAGVLTGRTGRDLLAHLPGGDLKLEWRESNNNVYMTGPATEVFSGEWSA